MDFLAAAHAVIDVTLNTLALYELTIVTMTKTGKQIIVSALNDVTIYRRGQKRL